MRRLALTNPAAAYRRVDLDARIEAARADELTRICLEEAVAALSQALYTLNRKPDAVPRERLSRAHSIAVYLARSVAPDNPIPDALTRFYGGLAKAIGANMNSPRVDQIKQARQDLQDVLIAISF